MAIALPGEDRLPPGPRRELARGLQEMYERAGRPGSRVISRDAVRDETLATVSHETVSSVLRGRSIPSWSKVEAYDKARPGTSDWILSMVEQRAAHSRRVEFEAHRIRRLGYVLAFCSILVLAGVAVYFVDRSAPTQGAAVIASGAVAITGIFVTGRSLNRVPEPAPIPEQPIPVENAEPA